MYSVCARSDVCLLSDSISAVCLSISASLLRVDAQRLCTVAHVCACPRVTSSLRVPEQGRRSVVISSLL